MAGLAGLPRSAMGVDGSTAKLAAPTSSIRRGGTGIDALPAGGIHPVVRPRNMATNFLNNPYLLCRETENVRPVPCGTSPQLCEYQSLQTYGMPGLMQCSPVGLGCCLKDFMSMHMANLINW